MEVLKDDDPGVRQQMAEMFGKLGPKAWRAVPPLTKLLYDKQNAVRKEAIITIGRIGPDAKYAVPSLVTLLLKEEDHRVDVAKNAHSLGKAGVPDVLEVLAEKKGFGGRILIINVLGELGPDAKEAIKPLSSIEGSDRFPRVRDAAKDALVKIGKAK